MGTQRTPEQRRAALVAWSSNVYAWVDGYDTKANYREDGYWDESQYLHM